MKGRLCEKKFEKIFCLKDWFYSDAKPATYLFLPKVVTLSFLQIIQICIIYYVLGAALSPCKDSIYTIKKKVFYS